MIKVYQVWFCNNEEWEDYHEYLLGSYLKRSSAETKLKRAQLSIDLEEHYQVPSIELRELEVIVG